MRLSLFISSFLLCTNASTSGDDGGPAIESISSMSVPGCRLLYNLENGDSSDFQLALILKVPSRESWTASDSAKLEYLFKHDYSLFADDFLGGTLITEVREDCVVFIKNDQREELVSTMANLLGSLREFEVSDGVAKYLAEKINDHNEITPFHYMAETAIDLMLGRRFFDDTMMKEISSDSITLESMKEFRDKFVSTAMMEALIWGKRPISVIHETFNLLSSYSSPHGNVETPRAPWTLPPARSSIRHFALSSGSNAMHVLLLIDGEENSRARKIASLYGQILDELIEEHRHSSKDYYFQNVRVLYFNRHAALSIIIIGDGDNHDAKDSLEKMFVRSQQVILQMTKDEFRKRSESFKESFEEHTFMGQLSRIVFGFVEPTRDNPRMPIGKREMMRFIEKYILPSGSNRREICLQLWDNRQYAHRLEYIRSQDSIPVANSMDDVAAYLHNHQQ